jgi:hypothetical protein
MRPVVRLLRIRWIETTSASRRSSSLETSRAPASSGRLRRQVLTPCDDVHTESKSYLRHLGSDVAQPDEAEGVVRHVVAYGPLPASGPQGCVLRRDVPRAREDQRPCQLDRRA